MYGSKILNYVKWVEVSVYCCWLSVIVFLLVVAGH